MISYQIGSHSGSGMSFYKVFGACPKRATLNALTRSAEPTALSDTATTRGTVGHAFAELYYGGVSFEPEDVLFTPGVASEALRFMSALWREYRKKFPADEWGKVIEIEAPLEGPAVEEAVGVAPYTTRLDMVVELGDEECIRALVQQRQDLAMVGLKPGQRYVIDHKFVSANNAILVPKYRNSLQLVAYQLAWNAAHPEAPVSGAIANVVVKTKKPQYVSIFQPPPTDVQIEALRHVLGYWRSIADTNPWVANPLEENCFGYSVCNHFESGACDRTSGLVQIGGV